MEWKSALYKAVKKGNEIHDELFEGEGVDVAVEDAVEMAGTECFVQYIGQGLGSYWKRLRRSIGRSNGNVEYVYPTIQLQCCGH